MSEHNLSSNFFSALTKDPSPPDQPTNAESRSLANWKCEQRQAWRTANSSGEKQLSWRDRGQGQKATSAFSSWRGKPRKDESKSTSFQASNVFGRPNVAENSTSPFGGPRNKFGTNFKTPSSGSATPEWTCVRSAFGESKSKFGSNLSIASDRSTSSELPDPRKREHRSFGSRPSWSSASDSRAAGSRSFNRHASNKRAESFIDPKTGKRVESTKSPKLSLEYLEALSRKEPHEIALEVTIAKTPFDAYLEKSPLEPDWLILIVSIVAKVCDSDYEGNRSDLLYKLCESPFFDTLSNYLGDVSMETDPLIIEKLPEFVTNLCGFYASLLDAWPMVAVEKNLKKMITKTKVAAGNITEYLDVQIDENVGSKLETFIDKFDEYKKMVEEKKSFEKRIRSKVQKIADSAPPDDFRSLSVYPTKDDLFRTQRGYVRPNKTRGAYQNVEHYLDVQFRLLREDFVDSVRSGIQKYLASKLEPQRSRRFKFDNVRVYPETVLESWERRNNLQVGILLNFDPKKRFAKTCDWAQSKRFMHGSLLLLTADDFNTFVCATVLERDINSLKDGCVLAALVQEIPDIHKMLARPFTMVESEVFFEPYFLILMALKNLGVYSFPMREYIVKGQSETKAPLYPDDEEVENDLFSFRAFWSPPEDFLYHDLLSIARLWNWATQSNSFQNRFNESTFELDAHQEKAYHAGLNQDFCVIQGPPGTGKTFLGLIIVKSILDECIRNAKQLPILVICLTNHALDQFLERIIEFTNRVVRVGGQSRNENLDCHNLRALKSKFLHMYKRVTKHYDFQSATSRIKKEIAILGDRIEQMKQMRKWIETPRGILPANLLKQVVNPNYLHLVENDDTLLEWLLDDNEYESSLENEFVNFCHLYGNEAIDSEVTEPVTRKCERNVFFDESKIEITNHILGYSVTIDELKNELQCMKDEYDDLIENEDSLLEQGYDSTLIYFEKAYLKNHIKVLTRQFHKLKTNLEASVEKPEEWILNAVPDPWKLPSKSRWQIYWSWLSGLQNELGSKMIFLEERRRTKMIQFEEYKMFEDLQIMRQAHVVGMTTTGAARLNKLLALLKPAIVIVEEAAEVLEAHIVASLTNSCQHLILIGDHKQLKPSSAVYELSKHYNIDVSLFERMINNGMYCPMLKVQHRMRPEISSLITPLIYPDLQNHESVQLFEPVMGTKKNMFFIEHNVPEQVTDDETSKENLHEAQFVVQLAKYLLAQGHPNENITVLTFYAGQMFLIRNLMKKSGLFGVNCVVVDKFQGEENRIILLSLVRSNVEGNIGFLSIENRVCVALSRAKSGFFMIGNMDCLAKTKLWQKLNIILQQNDAIGKKLPLYCSHHNKTTPVATAADFHSVPDGGCGAPCNMKKECGHLCQKLCHPMLEEHLSVNCEEPCLKMCPLNHQCRKPCNEKCGPCVARVSKLLPCQHFADVLCHENETPRLCTELMEEVTLPCDHVAKRMCHQDPVDVVCVAVCEELLDCGHTCNRLCHKDDPDHSTFQCDQPCKKYYKGCKKDHLCNKLCYENCEECPFEEDVILSCGHKFTLSCRTDLNSVNCQNSCDKICLQCDLKCMKKCWQDCYPCTNKVKKIIPTCGHEMAINCFQEPNQKLCQQSCQLIAPCGHKCQSMCSEVCSSKGCKEWVTSTVLKPVCGHEKIYVLCGEKNNISYRKPENFLEQCQEPCNAILECGDACSGTCGQCWQERLHQICQKSCTRTFICGHRCKFPCRKLCPPCNEPCSFQCPHSKCTQKCGIPCSTCKKPCEWKCKHSKCTRKCGDICNRQPCNKPCEVKLPCSHDCIGFCGEPCPPQCRFCNPEIGGAPDARFVLMVDCDHTIESRTLDQHFSSAFKNGEIAPRGCPVCGTPVTKTLRYMNDVKRIYRQIAEVKTKTFEDLRSFDTKQMFSTFSRLLVHCKNTPFLVDLIKFCDSKIPDRSKKFVIFSPEILSNLIYFLQACRAMISHFSQFQMARGQSLYTLLQPYLEKLARGLKRADFNANKQFMRDFALELRRYHLMVDYQRIKNCSSSANKAADVTKICADVEQKLFGFAKFTDEEAAEVKELFEKLMTTISIDTSWLKRELTVKKELPRIFDDLTAGRWFQCANGHYYYKGADGKELADCPECVEMGAGKKKSGQRRRRRRR